MNLENLTSKGFHVFPLVPNTKSPAIKKFNDIDILQTVKIWPNNNIGIATDFYAEDKALVVVDIDTKDGAKGYDTLLELELSGKDFPPTYTQETPTGGLHYFYWHNRSLKQGAGVLGKGIDIRSRGGYVVAAGSQIDGKYYTSNDLPVAPCPLWLVDTLTQREHEQREVNFSADINEDLAAQRAIEYLTKHAPKGEQGSRNDTAYKVACALKDFGVPSILAEQLISEHWDCVPMIDGKEIAHCVNSAYSYGQSTVGNKAPEADFEKVEPSKQLNPFEKINQDYAFVISGGSHHILWETKDYNGNQSLIHLSETSFHKQLASQVIIVENKFKQVTQEWIKHPLRRSYKGLCFKPGLETPEGFYNLWKGFSVKPSSNGSAFAKKSLEMFLDHSLKNVCGGNLALHNWLIGYFAHLIQKPYEKPLVALVFRGQKGVGKNALIERVGHLLGNHFLLTSKKRYLTSNFNGHLENNLMFVLDEAFWSGDKEAEGTLKDLITGTYHVIEHKGHEPYKVDNCTRICIIGNEDWLVPASHDERRFAVFQVGNGRRLDRNFFKSMREGMEQGGYELLLDYLMNFDISKLDVNQAPDTEALIDQKISSLGLVQEWWSNCLDREEILHAPFTEGWPEEISYDGLRNAIYEFAKRKNIRARLPDQRQINKDMRTCFPSIETITKREGNRTAKFFKLPGHKIAHRDWENFLGIAKGGESC